MSLVDKPMKLSDIFFINPEGFPVALKTIAMMSYATFFFLQQEHAIVHSWYWNKKQQYYP